jgi:hypothetical protein
MPIQTTPLTPVSHLDGGDTATTPGRDEAAQLRQRSVRQLIAELAELENASRSTAAVRPPGQRARDRAREGRIEAELRRRHAGLGSWGFAEPRVAARRVGDRFPRIPAVDPRGRWLGSG